MMHATRREFTAQAISAAVAFGLIETLWANNLFADGIKPTIKAWLKELVEMTNDLRDHKLTDLEFQKKMEELFARVNLAELTTLLKLEELERTAKLPDSGAANLGIDLSKVDGLPTVRFGRQIFGCKKGRSIVPHGHQNMCTGFIILKGDWRGRHYDKIETLKDGYLIKPTIDREFKPGQLSTISDHKDNVHWFQANSDSAYIFNVHVVGYDPTIKGASSRLYLDPDGEKVSGGLIKAPKMTSEACHKKYG